MPRTFVRCMAQQLGNMIKVRRIVNLVRVELVGEMTATKVDPVTELLID